MSMNSEMQPTIVTMSGSYGIPSAQNLAIEGDSFSNTEIKMNLNVFLIST